LELLLYNQENNYAMQKIKVMVASRPQMLSDVIRNMIDRQPDMIMVGEVIDPIKLLFAIRETPVDVVIMTPLKVNGEPKICSHLLVEYPSLKVFTLSAKGEAAYLYQSGAPKLRIDDPCGQSILEAIREALMPTSS
jgi:DNA-binding NarL/FixJ family response regulator